MVAVPREQVERTTESVHRLLRLHARPMEIAQQLGMKPVTVYKYIARIREENSEKLRALRAEGFTVDIMMAIESYEEQIRQLQVIRRDARSDFAKIEATNSIVDIETLILNLKGYLPRLLEEEAMARRAAQALEIDAKKYQPVVGADYAGPGYAPASEAQEGTTIGTYGEGYIEQAPGELPIQGSRRDGGDRSEEEEASETL